MKSHSVKSNAKRAARKLCEQFPKFMPAEAVAVFSGEWFPAVAWIGEPGEVPADVSAIAVIVAGSAVLPEAGTANDAPAFLRKDFPVSAGFTPAEHAKPSDGDMVTVTKTAAVGQSIMSAADVAKAIGPATKSTPEEVAARRQERMERVKAEADEPKAEKPKTGKTATALELIRRKEGASNAELQEALGWLPHTVRGFVSTQNSKNAAGIVGTRDKLNKTTVYSIPAKADAA